MSEGRYKSLFPKPMDPDEKVFKVRKRIDLGYASFFPGEAFIPKEFAIDKWRLKILWEQRYLEAFDEEDDREALIEKFNKKVRILRAGEKVIGRKVG